MYPSVEQKMTSNVKRSSIIDISVNDMLKFVIKDLNNLTSDLTEKIFSVLTPKEVSLLCGTSKKFNSICKRESFWRNKVLNDYGVEKKFGKTWRETAKNMSQVNMINLNDEWINGETYRKILDESLKGNDVLEYIHEIQRNALIKIFGRSTLDVTYTWIYPPELLCTTEHFVGVLEVFCKKMQIIHLSLIISTQRSLFLSKYVGGVGPSIFMGNFLVAHLIDPIIYVMQYSTFPKTELDDALRTYWMLD